MVASVDSSALVNGVKPIDIAGAMDKGNTALQGEIETKQKQQAYSDQQVVRDLSSVPGVDFSTPKGIKEFTGHLQGRVDPSTVMKFNEMATKMQDAENQRIQVLAQQTDEDRKRYLAQADLMSGALAPVVAEKDITKRKALLETTLGGLAEEKLPNGEPVYSPQMIDKLRKTDPTQLDSIYNGSTHAASIAKIAKEQADAAKAKALAEESQWRTQNPELGKEYHSKTNPGKIYYKGKRGDIEVDAESGEQKYIAGLPQDVEEVGSPAASRMAKAEEMLDFSKNPVTPAEEEMARVYRVTRKMESLGQNSPLRPRIAKIAAEQAIAEGRNVVGDNIIYKSESANAAKLTSIYGNIKGSENTVLGNLELMKPLISKVDATGVPVLERWIRAGKRAIEGDPDVTQLNSLVVSTQSDIAKVLSQATGAAGIPVAAMEEAKKYMNGDLTQQQFNALYDIVPKEMKVRTDSIEAQIAGSINKINRLVGDPKTSKHETVDPKVQADRDGKSVEIWRQELAKSREAYRTETDPVKKKRLEDDIAGLEREIAKASGGAAPAEKPKSKPTVSNW